VPQEALDGGYPAARIKQLCGTRVPEPVTKGLLLASEIIISAMDVLVAGIEVSYAHWVVTGEPINSWDDVSNWEMAP
jgi:hypothetical protein